MVAMSGKAVEIVFTGSLQQIKEPQKTIIVRERTPFSNLQRPGFARTYLFADGHVEIYSSIDGDFETWEKERLASADTASAQP